MIYNSAKLAVLGLASLSASHMIMTTPKPFTQHLDNSPLDKSGSDFPCKQPAGSVLAANGVSNSMALGSSQPLQFEGVAVHGGGSCQVSVTYDKAPTKDSVFKVIHSIVGGCPSRTATGNLPGDDATVPDPDAYSFTVPSNLPTGDAILAWTWFNHVGNREMYMNCAPITITSAASKREEEFETRNTSMLFERDTAAFNALPNMFVANVDNGCATVVGDLKFPDLGQSVEMLGAGGDNLQNPVGSCAAGGSTSNPSSVTPVASSAPVTSSVPVATSAPALGGVFITVSSSAVAAPSVVPVVSSVVSVIPSVVPVVSSAAGAKPTSVVSAAPTPISSSVPASTGTTGSGSAEKAGSACTIEGMWNCISGTSFQQCASGTWSVVQQLAAGTTCSAGKSTNINIVAIGKKRNTRFSSAHVRRHAQHLQHS